MTLAEWMAQEKLTRLAACLPVNEQVGGYAVRPLTLRDFAMLTAIDSPYLPPFREATAAETLSLLWLLSPDYVLPTAKNWRKNYKRFLRQKFPFAPPLSPLICFTIWGRGKFELQKIKAQIEHDSLQAALRSYIAEALQDVIAGGSADDLLPAKEYYSDAVAVACQMARVYGGGLEIYFDMPLKIIFQAMKINYEFACAKAGRAAMLSNPSDFVLAEDLNQKNRDMHASGVKMHPDAVAYFQAHNGGQN